MSESISNNTPILVHTGAGDVTVRKLALGDYAGVLRAMGTLPAALGDMMKKDKSELTTDYLIGVLPAILADHLEEFAGILASATDKDAAFFTTQVDLAEAAEVLGAALELNDYSRIAVVIKKIRAGRQPKA